MARILVIDDESNIRKMIGLALEKAGHVVEAEPDGRSGLNTYGNGEQYDLVLLDQRMPEMDGIEVLHEMRRRNPAARIIMITAFGTIDLAVDAMRSGAADFLRKPFALETLRGAVESALRIRYEPEAQIRDEQVELAFGLTTLNGYHIESKPEQPVVSDTMTYGFSVRSPSGEVRQCSVSVAPDVVESVKRHVGKDEMPGGNRFWHALCEHVLADFLWQDADYPPENALFAKEFSGALRSWVDAVIELDGKSE